MLRFRTALLILLFIAIGDAATKDSGSEYSPKLILVVIVLAAWYIYSTSTNDLADEEIDKINLKGNSERPLANGQIERSKLWRIASVSGGIAILLSLAIGKSAIIMTLIALLLSWIYSFPPIRLSARGVVAPLTLPIGYVAFPLLLVASVNKAEITYTYLLLLFALYFSFTGRILLKDFRDVVGDEKYGKRTFVVRYGQKMTCIASAIAWVLGLVAIIIRFSNHPIVIICIIPFIVNILLALVRLSRYSLLQEQLQYIGLIGRLANGAAFILLTALYFELNPERMVAYSIILVLLVFFIFFSCWILYEKALKETIRVLKP
jgi:4-hydroxybenzoate polyprenyltransferase